MGLALVAVGLIGASGCGSGHNTSKSGGPLGRNSSLDPAVQRVVALRPLRGVIYKPAPSDYDGKGNGLYFDSDFTNEDFDAMWGPDGRNDIGKLAAAGVNFLHIYDWNQPGSGRRHTSFLNYCQQKGVSVAVPVSAWYVKELQKGAAPAAWFDAFVSEVYPAGRRHPAVVMWTVGNEFDNGYEQTADGIARTTKAIVDAEDRAGIPADQRIAITSPVTFGIRGATGVEGADATLQLQQAFTANGIGDVFSRRFIASVNAFNPGSDLGPWASTRFPLATGNIPFCLFEMGREIGTDPNATVKTEEQQGAFYAAQLAAMMPLAKGNGPYLGQCVFSTVNEAWKGGTEATFGIYRIAVPGGEGLGFTNNLKGYPLDTLAEKPTFASMRNAYTAP